VFFSFFFKHNSWTRLNLLQQWQIFKTAQALGECALVYPLSHIMDLILLTTSLKVQAYKMDTYTYNIESALVVSFVSRSGTKGCVSSCYIFPATMQIICHYIDHIQVPKITILCEEAADGCLHFLYLQFFFSLYQLHLNWSISLVEFTVCLKSNSLINIWCTHALWTYLPSAGTS